MSEFAIFEINYSYKGDLKGKGHGDARPFPCVVSGSITIVGRARADKVLAYLASMGIEADLHPYHPTTTVDDAIRTINDNLQKFPPIKETAA